MSHPYVESFPAGEFVCDKCGKNSYFSMVNIENELSEKELVDLYKKMKEKPPPKDTKGFWLMCPFTVICSYCKTEFSTFDGIMNEIDDINED